MNEHSRKCFDIWGILDLATVESLKQGNINSVSTQYRPFVT